MAKLPKKYIKLYGISKKAWREYRKSLKGSKNRTTTTKSRKVRKTARRRYRRKRRRRAPRTIAIAPAIGLAIPLVDPIKSAMAGDWDGAVNHLSYRFLGWDRLTNSFDWQGLVQGYGPMVFGAIGHKIANMTGINRMLAKLPAPLNKLRV